MDASAIGIKVGLELLRRTAPTGLAWLTTYTRGIELLIIGPGGAGKTSISDYLEFGILEEEGHHEKTLDIQKSTAFAISVGRDAALKLRIRRTVDVPGQTGPVEHANLIRERRPHAVLIVLDGTHTCKQLAEWMDPFCERLDHLLREDKRVARKLRGIVVALNKRDRVRRTTDYDARKRQVRSCLVNGLSEVLGRQFAKSISTLPTVAVQSKHGTTMLDALIRKIARQLAK